VSTGASHGADAASLRFERALLLVLCAATVLAWSLQFHPFALPNNDYASFENVAESLARAELPRSFVRAPIFPGLMALVAPMLPGPHPYLQAALVLNLLFSLALLLALHGLAERTLGRGAILAPALFATTNQFHSMGLQPLVEPSLGFFVVLAFLLCQHRSPWQYAAAGAAALSRSEAALLLAVLGLVNWLGDRQFRRHFVLAVLGGLPFLGWLVLGALRGSGAAWYLEEVGGSGFNPAIHFFVTALREPLRGWWGDGAGEQALFAIVIGVPLALGVRAGLARFPRETAAMLLYWVLTTIAVVAFGVDKGRYVYAAQWIPLFLLAAGLLEPLRPELRSRLERIPAPILAAICAGGGLILIDLLRTWGLRVAAQPRIAPLPVDLAWLALAAVLLPLAILPVARAASWRGRAAIAAALLPALLVTTPLLGAGMRTKARELYKIHWGNHGIVVASRWVEDHAKDSERAVVLHKAHYVHLTGWDSERFVSFRDLEASGAAELAAAVRAADATLVIATWRKPVAQSIDEVYERKYKWFLVDPFLEGKPVPGFQHVASIPLPDHLERGPVQIYRLAPTSPDVAPPGAGG
jgi:hypothetical protein